VPARGTSQPIRERASIQRPLAEDLQVWVLRQDRTNQLGPRDHRVGQRAVAAFGGVGDDAPAKFEDDKASARLFRQKSTRTPTGRVPQNSGTASNCPPNGRSPTAGPFHR